MRVDLRVPVGGLFALLGLLLAGYGLFHRGARGTAPTGVPIDLVWGAVMLAFGLVMLGMARRRR